MALRKAIKRRSPCMDTIFLEVNDNDLSPEHNINNDNEPEIKIMKTGNELLEQDSSETPFFEIDESLTEESKIILDVSSSSIDEDKNSLVSDNISQEEVIGEGVKAVHKPFGELTDTLPVDTTHKLIDKDFKDGELIALHKINDIPIKEIDSNISSDSKIHITFGNKQLSDSYKLELIKFFQSYVELEIINETELSITIERDVLLNPCEWVILDEHNCTKHDFEETSFISNLDTPSKSKKKKAKKKKKDTFILDTHPSECDPNIHATQYLSKFQIDKEEQKVEDVSAKITSVQMCFNCNGSHNLKDCPDPKDYAKISAERNKFKTQKQTK